MPNDEKSNVRIKKKVTLPLLGKRFQEMAGKRAFYAETTAL